MSMADTISPTPADPSMRDASTELPNRRSLLAALRERVPSGSGALVLLDLDAFKKATRSLRREGLDGLLRTVAGRLLEKAGPGALLHRYSLDAFALLLPGADRDAAALAADGLRSALAQDAFIVGGASGASEIVPLTATAAVAAWPLDGRTPASLVETAELALLAAKHQGPDRTAIAGRLDPGVLAEIGIYRGLPSPVMVGRVQEQSRLRQAANDVRHVGPTCALVTGPSGLGKSRLLEELGRWGRTEHLVVLNACCQEARGTLPYSALAELLEPLLLNNDPHLRGALQNLSTLQRTALAVVVRGLAPAGPLAEIPLADYGRLIQESFSALLDELAKAGSLLILIDEAEHADAATFNLLDAARERRLPFLAVLATNQDPLAFAGTPAGGFHKEGPPSSPHIVLNPLSPEEIEQLLHAVLPESELAPGSARALVGRSLGNPLYLEETVRALLLRGRAKLSGGRWTLPALEERDLPKDLEAAVLAVAAALPARANSLLTRAAVIGTEVDPELLQEVLGQDELEMLELIDEARRSRLLVASESGADLLHFPASHARRLRLASTPAAERKEIHGRVGVAQEARHGGDVAHLADELAFHYSRAGNESRARHFDGIARQRAALLQPPQAEGSRRARLDPVVDPLDPDALGHATALFRHLLGALKVGRLYPQWSQVSASFLVQLREELEKLMAVVPGVTISNPPSGPRLNGVPAAAGPVAEFAVLLDEHLLESMTLLRSFDRAGLDVLLRAFLEPLDRLRAEADHWDRFLAREGLEGIDLVQKAYQARESAGARLEAREEKQVPSEELAPVRDALRMLKAATDAVKLYPPGHALVEETATSLVGAAIPLLQRLPSLTFGATEGELVLNGRPADRKFFGEAGLFLLQEIERRELKSLSLVRGLRGDEVRALVSFLALAPGEQAAALQRLEGQFVHILLGSRSYERATEGVVEISLAPPPKPIRSEIRAKEHLAQPYEAFLGKPLLEQFSALVEVLAYGSRRPLAEELVARVSSHFHDVELPHRRLAYRLLGSTIAFASPSARQVEVGQSAAPLRKRLLEDTELPAFKLAADLLNLWIPAAATAGCLRELAEIAGPVLRRRASAAGTPKDIAASCERVLTIMPDTGAYAVLLAAVTRTRTEERLPAVSILLAIGGKAVERLVDVLVGEPDRQSRMGLAMAIGLSAGEVAVPLSKGLGPETSVDKLQRVLEVSEPLLSPALLGHFAELADHGRPELRRAILSHLEHWPESAAPPILRRLAASTVEANRDAALDSATRMKSAAISTEVGRLLEQTQDEHVMRICCRYFAAVPNAGAIPLLTRIVERKPRMFGLVKGYAEGTRREAAEALSRQIVRPAAEALDNTLHDPVTKLRNRK